MKTVTGANWGIRPRRGRPERAAHEATAEPEPYPTLKPGHGPQWHQSWWEEEATRQLLPRSEQSADREFHEAMRKRVHFEIEVIRATGEGDRLPPKNLSPERLAELWFDAG